MDIRKIGYLEQLKQFLDGPIWDGDLIGKPYRTELVKKGLVIQIEGWNLITVKGVKYLLDLGILRS